MLVVEGLVQHLASRIYEADSVSAVQELYHSNGWTDGLPIVPPTEDAVRACLEWVMMPPDQLIGIEPVRGHADHRREARDQRRDGGLPADAFPGRRDRVDGDDAGGRSCCTAPPPAPAAAPSWS